MTIPDRPPAKFRTYVLTEAGMALTDAMRNRVPIVWVPVLPLPQRVDTPKKAAA